MNRLLSVFLIAIASANLVFAEEGKGEKPETTSTIKDGAKKSAQDVKKGLQEYGKTMKKTGRKLKDHSVDSYERDKAKIKKDIQKMKGSDSKESEK
jgi:hypothetical protein